MPKLTVSDTRHPPGSEEKLFAAKLEAAVYYEKAASERKITCTTVTNGALIDLGVYSLPPGNPAQPNCWPLVNAVLPRGFLGVDFNARKATLYDEGKRKPNMTTLGDVAHALVSILDKREETKNKVL